MAIKGTKAKDVVSIFDPDKGAYREVRLEDLRKQLEGLGFTAAEVNARLKALKTKEEE
jgi:hypothetical protein